MVSGVTQGPTKPTLVLGEGTPPAKPAIAHPKSVRTAYGWPFGPRLCSCWIMASVTCTLISRPIWSEDTAGMSKSSRCFQVLLTFSLTSLCGGTFNLGTVHTGWMWTGMFTACFPVSVTRRLTALELCGVPLFSMFPRQSSHSGPSVSSYQGVWAAVIQNSKRFDRVHPVFTWYLDRDNLEINHSLTGFEGVGGCNIWQGVPRSQRGPSLWVLTRRWLRCYTFIV